MHSRELRFDAITIDTRKCAAFSSGSLGFHPADGGIDDLLAAVIPTQYFESGQRHHTYNKAKRLKLFVSNR